MRRVRARGHAARPAARPSGAASDAATEAYLGRSDRGRSRGDRGRVSRARRRSTIRSRARCAATSALDAFVAERHAWLAARAARLTPGPITRAAGRTVVEAVLHLHHEGRDVDLPIAVVGDDAPDGRRARAARLSFASGRSKATTGSAPPLLRRDPAALTTGAVAEYQRALAAGDVDAIVATFEPDGYFREPSGEPWVHRGPAELRKFMTQILAAGGIGIEHATVTDDGKTCAIEFNAVRFGKRAITPQAGLAIYERGPTGRLRAARIYDDVNVEVLQQQ